MTAVVRSAGTGLFFCALLSACGGGESNAAEEPVNLDYSALEVAASRDGPLVYARNDNEVLPPLRNGMRLAVRGGLGVALPTGAFTPSLDSQAPHSDTTVQIEGVDEADSVKYDGRYIYVVRPEIMPASPSGMPKTSSSGCTLVI